ncbi:MAG: hypothetical protein WA192_02350 [Candidatus Acidiferrales bacterium]
MRKPAQGEFRRSERRSYLFTGSGLAVACGAAIANPARQARLDLEFDPFLDDVAQLPTEAAGLVTTSEFKTFEAMLRERQQRLK